MTIDELREQFMDAFSHHRLVEHGRTVSPEDMDVFVELAQSYANSEREEIEKAYGGCHKCYGKGYATVSDGTIGYEDFGGEGFKTPITTKMKFCTCERGKQLAELSKPQEGGK